MWTSVLTKWHQQSQSRDCWPKGTNLVSFLVITIDWAVALCWIVPWLCYCFVCRLVHPTQGGWLALALQHSVRVYLLLCVLSWGQTSPLFSAAIKPGDSNISDGKQGERKITQKCNRRNLPEKHCSITESRAAGGQCVKSVCAFPAGIWSGECALWKEEKKQFTKDTNPAKTSHSLCFFPVLKLVIIFSWSWRRQMRRLIWNLASSLRWSSQLLECFGKMLR